MEHLTEHLGRFEGEHVWLICGGPSIRGFDLESLDGCTASINEIGIDCLTDIWIGGNQRIKYYPGSFWTRETLYFVRKDVDQLPRCGNLVTWKERTDRELNVSGFLEGDSVCWGAVGTLDGKRILRNSIMLAAFGVLCRLGFREVRLLGCDWQQSQESLYGHDHRSYEENGIRYSNEQFQIMEQWFSQLRPQFERSGFHVVNCTDGGSLEVFERRDWRNFLLQSNCNKRQYQP